MKPRLIAILKYIFLPAAVIALFWYAPLLFYIALFCLYVAAIGFSGGGSRYSGGRRSRGRRSSSSSRNRARGLGNSVIPPPIEKPAENFLSPEEIREVFTWWNAQHGRDNPPNQLAETIEKGVSEMLELISHSPSSVPDPSIQPRETIPKPDIVQTIPPRLQAPQSGIVHTAPQPAPPKTELPKRVPDTEVPKPVRPEVKGEPVDLRNGGLTLLDPKTKAPKTFYPEAGDTIPPRNGEVTNPPKNDATPNPPKDIERPSATRAAVPETQITFLHRQMQKEIYECLIRQNQTGRTVGVEVSGIDILVKEARRAVLIEIKTGDNEKSAIRDAVGQLLEYSYFCRQHLQCDEVRFLIVSPHPTNPETETYMAYLRSALRIRVDYRQYVPGSYSFEL